MESVEDHTSTFLPAATSTLRIEWQHFHIKMYVDIKWRYVFLCLLHALLCGLASFFRKLGASSTDADKTQFSPAVSFICFCETGPRKFCLASVSWLNLLNQDSVHWQSCLLLVSQELHNIARLQSFSIFGTSPPFSGKAPAWLYKPQQSNLWSCNWCLCVMRNLGLAKQNKVACK